MSLTAKQIITFLSLSGVGRSAVLCYTKYAERSGIQISSEQDFLKVMSYCRENEGCRVNPEKYDVLDIRKAMLAAERILNECEALGIGIVGYSDKDFPVKLRSIISKKTSAKGKVSEKDESPVVLYYKGSNISRLNDMPAVAIIGTREPTPEGEKAATFMAQKFTARGFNIVGGLAMGCDAHGHQGALDTDGITTAFLAHGLHTVFPKENTGLADEIVKNGGFLMSEYAPGIEPYPTYFVERDRLQSGLADATVVIQTSVNGGTMHAVNATEFNDKPLFAVSYSSERLMMEDKVKGNELLINNGRARAITSSNVDECVEEVWTNAKSNGKPSMNEPTLF